MKRAKKDTRNYGKDHSRFAGSFGYAEGGAVGDDYNTDLGEDEDKFQEWKARTSPDDSGHDYDLRGAYKEGIERDETGHMPDKFKKPSHPTFSIESKYANDSKKTSTPGSWIDDEYIPGKGY